MRQRTTWEGTGHGSQGVNERALESGLGPAITAPDADAPEVERLWVVGYVEVALA
jgi:hypothetical protein